VVRRAIVNDDDFQVMVADLLQDFPQGSFKAGSAIVRADDK
jgi:thymidine kinase